MNQNPATERKYPLLTMRNDDEYFFRKLLLPRESSLDYVEAEPWEG